MAKVRRLEQRTTWGFATVIALLKPPFLALTKRDWIDGEKIPAAGGCVVAVNHISHIDPLTLGLLLYNHGRQVRYLTKDALFDVPIVGRITTSAKQIPVSRLSADAAKSYEAACQAVLEGECVGIYPEGTITRDPDGWPMRGKTGAARIGLSTGCPVIPIGQWGAQEILPAYTAKPHLLPRKTTHYKVGDPVDLDDLIGKPIDHAVLQEATDRIMAAITGLVEDLRGATAPTERFDPRKAGVKQIGNPNKEPKRKHE